MVWRSDCPRGLEALHEQEPGSTGVFSNVTVTSVS